MDERNVRALRCGASRYFDEGKETHMKKDGCRLALVARVVASIVTLAPISGVECASVDGARYHVRAFNCAVSRRQWRTHAVTGFLRKHICRQSRPCPSYRRSAGRRG